MKKERLSRPICSGAERRPQRQHCLRAVFNALRYLIKIGCGWRDNRCFEHLLADLRELGRREAEPTAVILDARTLQSTLFRFVGRNNKSVSLAIPPETKNPASESETGFNAEGMGFEPTITFWAIHTFQACSFDHSDTPLGLMVAQRNAGFPRNANASEVLVS